MKELCKKADVILLQETFWKDEMMDCFKRRWKGGIYCGMAKGLRFYVKET
ncbi:hypothetical protein [Cetobacterium sp.]